MKRTILTGVLLAFAVGAVLADDKALKELEGTYKVATLTKAGAAVPDEVRKAVTVKFKGDEMSFVFPDRTLTAKIKLNVDKSPKWIDISPIDGPEKGKSFPGLYKMENDELVIAFKEKGDRPKEFKAEGEVTLMSLKKE